MKEKKIIVIGSCGLIGRSLVSDLLKSDYTVIAADSSITSLEELKTVNNHPKLRTMDCDITNEDSVSNLLLKSKNELGVIEGVVNCAYPKNSSYGKEFFDVSYESFSENLSLHLGASAYDLTLG